MTEEALNAELKRCQEDPEYFLRTYCRVKTEDGGTRKPTEKEIQHAVDGFGRLKAGRSAPK